MLQEIRDCLQILCEISTNIENPKISTRLTNMELKLGSIEKEMQHQSRFALIAFAYGIALATISIGLATKGEDPSGGLLLMLAGLGFLFLLGIIGIILQFTKRQSIKKGK